MHEMGKRFSGGERQRVAFARTLMQETPIIVLDEPTIGLDPKTELSLIETMFSATEEKTVIWITHHLVGIEHVDEVIFLDRGQIVMQGSHKQLLKENEKYRKLYELDKGI
ncbi:ABC transporter ATP-binding protein [Streptococcus pneumoniae]|nr:ABC transporter ATP-binding protein [Streptococcus pneumoniae]CJC48955.1 ABC transporter ATP-binding protein [Streptococcus pneumoniae]